jgi:hypothetical protein
MTITFENDSDIIVYALEKIISFARENQYLFVANCVWWIAGIIGLDSGLMVFIDNLEIQKSICQTRPISTIPRDIARAVSIEDTSSDYKPDPLIRTRRGRINPQPQTKRQLKKARQAENRPQTKRQLKKARQAENRKINNLQDRNQEADRNQRLQQIKATVIRNLSKE